MLDQAAADQHQRQREERKLIVVMVAVPVVARLRGGRVAVADERGVVIVDVMIVDGRGASAHGSHAR